MNDDFDLESELRKALVRVPAPDGFAGRVMQKLPAERTAGTNWWRMAVAAVLVSLAVLTGWQRHQRERHEEALKTQKQVVFAFRFAAEKLERVNDRLQHATPDINLEKKRGHHYEE